MAFKKAERTQLYLLCALFGPSGSGKTMTALLMAKGIAEKMGAPFAVIDTESRSASKYSDRIAFDVDDLKKKTVDDYIAAMNEAAKAGYKVLVIDSLSHAWRELTDEVDRIAQTSTSKNIFSPWAKVNPKQKRFIDAILNFPGHIIVTMRSKTEWVLTANKDGKTVPESIGLAPEQGKGIEYEFDLLIELDQKHQGTVTKDRTGKYQDAVIDRPGEDFGVALYDWLSSGTAAPATVPLPETIHAESETVNTGDAKTAPVKTSPAKQPKAGGQKEETLIEKIKRLVLENQHLLSSPHQAWVINQLRQEKTESQLNGVLKHLNDCLAKGGDLPENEGGNKRQNAAQKPGTQVPGTTPQKTGKAEPAAITPPIHSAPAGDLREQLKQDIESIITAVSESGKACFTEAEQVEARGMLQAISPDEKGVKDLEEFKVYMNDELTKRKAANAPKAKASTSTRAA